MTFEEIRKKAGAAMGVARLSAMSRSEKETTSLHGRLECEIEPDCTGGGGGEGELHWIV